MAVAIRTFTVVIHQAEEGGYWGEVVGLPGCVSQGETEDELRQNILEAIEAVQEASPASRIGLQPRSSVLDEGIYIENIPILTGTADA